MVGWCAGLVKIFVTSAMVAESWGEGWEWWPLLPEDTGGLMPARCGCRRASSKKMACCGPADR